MTGKQNIVFALGFSLMLVVFWFGGQWTVLWQTISPPKTPSVPASGSPLPKKPSKSPPQGHVFPKGG